MIPEAELEQIRERLAVTGRISCDAADVARTMRECGLVVSDERVLDALESLRRDSVGAGVLEDLLRLPGVTDVLVNGPREVFIDRGRGLEPADLRFVDDAQVRRLATRLAASIGRRLDDASPFVDGRLADGTRLHAVLAPIAEPGTCISLRIPATAEFSLESFVAAGSIPPEGAELLRALVAARAAFLISGGTGSGKTTLLAALLAEVPSFERIVIVEDSRELRPKHPHCVRLEGRPANAEGAGGIALTQLVRQALRMRPDRLVLGEVRGAELCDLLTALNTGHEGGCGTVHANSIADLPARLEALAALGGMSRDACHAQVIAALDVAIHVRRDRSGQRIVESLGVFRRSSTGEVWVDEAARFEDGRVRWGTAAGALQERLSWR
ncbi:MAG: TadA family conjugal transfer-associated ATPase [Propionibacteriaceae bacterium]|nr:TadA family conjugal transfer-associated ATPase [Propionibacteriaceae bacterium]